MGGANSSSFSCLLFFFTKGVMRKLKMNGAGLRRTIAVPMQSRCRMVLKKKMEDRMIERPSFEMASFTVCCWL